MINKFKFYLSLIIARCAYLGIRLLNRSSGTSFVGMLVLKICPDFLKYCSKYIKKSFVTVTGTNGKSTTSGLIAHILETAHQEVIHNLKGANMLTGVANVFALCIRPFRRFDYAVIESDEAYLSKLYDFAKSDYLVVTNLFRDQLDRYGELNTTANLILKAIKKNPDLKLILNADDPIVATFNETKYAVYYGFENVEYKCSYQHTSNAPSEVFNCKCKEELKYTKQFFAQQGHYICPHCGYKRPQCNYSADVTVFDDYSLISVKNSGITFEFKVGLAGLYNAYNALAAISFAFECGLNQEEIQKALDSYHAIFGRTEKCVINGNPAIIQLIKNPTGASEVLKTVDLNSNIVIAINDNYADGRDISWLWDSDFEQLKDAKKLVITSGTRANDMATRLKYAGIPQERIIVEPNIKKAIDKATTEGKTTILPSYTALLKLTKEKR